MKNKLMLFFCLLSCVMILSGCSSSNNVPPSPTSPGGVAGEYSVAPDSLGGWAVANQKGTIRPDMLVLSSINELKTTTLNVSDVFIWNEFYVYNYETGQWTQYQFPQSKYRSTNWISANANQIIRLNNSVIGSHLMAFYSCSGNIENWDCHGNGWQVEGMKVRRNLQKTSSLIIQAPNYNVTLNQPFEVKVISISNYSFPQADNLSMTVLLTPYNEFGVAQSLNASTWLSYSVNFLNGNDNPSGGSIFNTPNVLYISPHYWVESGNATIFLNLSVGSYHISKFTVQATLNSPYDSIQVIKNVSVLNDVPGSPTAPTAPGAPVPPGP